MHLTVVLGDGATAEAKHFAPTPAAGEPVRAPVLNGWDELGFDFLAVAAGGARG
jgi:hypothetical protein